MCAERQRGVSLIELLVALVIALLVALAAVGSATAFGAAQRQSVSASGTDAELLSALSAIKAEIGAAALGFVVGGINRCARWNVVDGGTTLDNSPFVPFRVTRDTLTGFDRLDLVLASDVKAAAPVRLAATSLPSADALWLRSWLPVQEHDRVLIAPNEGAGTCTVREVTSTEDAVPGGAPYTVRLAAAAFSAPTSYLPNDRVSVLGRIERRSIGVDTEGRLTMSGPSLPAAAALTEHIVAWRVQYGVADGASGGITWTDPVGAWSTLDSDTVLRVRALRLGVVARSPQRDKACDATTEAPRLFGAAVDVAAIDPASWRCYRYRRAETVVPLRNVAWGQP